jgi:peptidyl-prolyl cis-trans isomerase C
MGLFPKRQMVPEYSDVAFALAPGAISEPVKSSKGYYVIKSFGLYEVGPLPFEAVRMDLVRELEAKKFGEAREALEKELDERFVVESQALVDAKAFRAARAASKGMSAPAPAAAPAGR